MVLKNADLLSLAPIPCRQGGGDAEVEAEGARAANVMLATLFNDAPILTAMCSGLAENGVAEGGLCDPQHATSSTACGE